MKILLLLFSFAIAFRVGNTQQLRQINIGAIFYDDEYEIEETFRKTIQFINNKNEVNFELVPRIARLSQIDGPIVIETKAVELLEIGVAAIFGPSSKADSDIVSLICNYTGIPNILFDDLREQSELERTNHELSLNVYPSQSILSKAYADMLYNFGWKKFTIAYQADDANAHFRLQDLLQLRDIHEDLVRVRKFKRGDDYRILWKSIKGERRVVLDCTPDILPDLFNASIEFDLAGQFNHFLLTNLESHAVNLDEIGDNVTLTANVTGVCLRSKDDMCGSEDLSLDKTDWSELDIPTSKLLPDLVHDGVMLLYMALKNISSGFEITVSPMQYRYNDGKNERWMMGVYINQIMRSIAFSDDSNFHFGFMQFDDAGQRINFTLRLYEADTKTGLAVWNTKGHISQDYRQTNNTKKRIYKIATRKGEPYFMEKENCANKTGNDCYEGYAVDLIQALAEEMSFEYQFVPVADNAYGNLNKDTNQWNGIIGELINNDAHMGICDLTITHSRKTVVDFTVPFMQLGISILAYQKPMEEKPWSSFLDPFTSEVWIYVMVSIFIMAFLFLFMARISTDEWQNPHPCNKDPDVLENSWNLSNNFWLTMGSIMTAGSDILPRAAPMRTFNAMWWIFAVIIANSYTANLAAFLTNSKLEGSIKSIDDLAGQSVIKYGTLAGGSTFNFFAESNETTYRLAFNRMQGDDPSAYTKDNTEGVERVRKSNGSYMFLMETTSLEFNTERDCRLSMVGEKFGEKHYAIAVPVGAEYRSNLSVAILKLSERGLLFSLKKKWWQEKHNNTCTRTSTSSTDTPDLDFYQVRGIFYTLFVGVFIAYVIGITDFLLHAQHIASEEGITFKEAFVREIKFVLNIWNNKKPVTPGPSSRLSSNGSGATVKSGRSSKSRKSASRKITPTDGEAQETKSTRSLTNLIMNKIRDHKV